jgi:hypothetical protein
MVENNIYLFPHACGPMLIEYYSKLMKEPLPQHLKDLLAMLQEASGSADLGLAADAGVREQAVPQGALPDKPE